MRLRPKRFLAPAAGERQHDGRSVEVSLNAEQPNYFQRRKPACSTIDLGGSGTTGNYRLCHTPFSIGIRDCMPGSDLVESFGVSLSEAARLAGKCRGRLSMVATQRAMSPVVLREPNDSFQRQS